MKTNRNIQGQHTTGGPGCLVATNSPRTAIGRWSVILLFAVGLQTILTPPLQAATTKKEITDNGITSAVETVLKRDKGVAPDDVNVSTSQGIVTLTGSVDNVYVKERVVRIAESIRGVRGVIDRVFAAPVSRPDEDIRKDILMALLQDPATESYQVAVSVQNAVATLTGSVSSYAEQQLAARIAKGVKGVKEIRNNATINYLAKRTDTEIANDIKSRLQWDIWSNGELIKSEVKDGRVTLTGTIGSWISKSRAFDDSWVSGVKFVDDSGVKIEPRASNGPHQEHEFATRSDSEIKQAVQAALRLDPRVSPFAPDVVVEDGGVILGGDVGNLKAKISAAQDANNIVGVWRVDNLLKVKPNARPTDGEMEKQLKAALAWDSLLDSSTITVAVTKRVAYLSGTVDSSFEKAEAQDVASRTKGVISVRNRLKTEPEFANYYYDYSPNYNYDYSPYSYYGDWPYYSSYTWPYYNQGPNYDFGMYGLQPYMTDEQIKKSIQDGLFWSPFVDSDDIKVSVNEGVATLTGTVGTRIGLGEVGNDAYQGGASKVVNQVKVKHSAWWWWW
jgi:osmotically-inducible protein OsmY